MTIMTRTITKQQFQERLQKAHPEYKIIGQYINATTPTQFECQNKHIFTTQPSALLAMKYGCQQCMLNHKRHIFSMTRGEFIKKLKTANPTILLSGPYYKSSSHMLFLCTICGTKWKTIGSKLIKSNPDNRRGCPVCAEQRKYMHRDHTRKFQPQTMRQLKTAFQKYYPNWKLLTPFKNWRTPVTVKCPKGHIMRKHPNNILHRRTYCKECYKIACQNKLYQQVQNQIANTCPNYKILSKSISKPHKLKIKCDHNHVFIASAYNIIAGQACPVCNQYGHSIGEKKIAKYLDEHNIKYVSPFKPDTCRDKYPLHFDFKINNMLIEYQGQQHYQPVQHFGGNSTFMIQQKHDQIKRDWAIKHGYREIEIKYDQNINSILNKLFNNYAI